MEMHEVVLIKVLSDDGPSDKVLHEAGSIRVL